MDIAENILLQGNDFILDTFEKAFGLSGKRMVNMFHGKYTMDTYVDDVMIFKRVNLRKSSFDLLQNWRHPMAVRLFNFYTESSNMGRLILPPLHDTFEAWSNDKNLFDEKGHMSELFRDFIIELCDMVKSLHNNRIVMTNGVVLGDLYVEIFSSGGVKILVLLTDVKKSRQHSEINDNWKSVRDLIDLCCPPTVQLHPYAESFKLFIGKPTFTVEKLRQYPNNWSLDKKGQYLMALKSAEHRRIQKQIDLIDFKWPIKPFPDKLDLLINDSRAQGYHYNPLPFDYLKLLWDSYKHFGPRGLYVTYLDRDDFLKTVDVWSPNIWMVLFERIGWP